MRNGTTGGNMVVGKIGRGCLIGVGLVALLWLCAPLVTGVMLTFTARRQYNSDPPHKGCTLIVTNTDMAVTLWRKQRPRAVSYEGEYRVVEVVKTGRSSQFYQILPTSAGDVPRLVVYWHPDERVLRFRDEGLRDEPRESKVNVESSTVFHVCRDASGETVLTDPCTASNSFCFPPFGASVNLAFTKPNSPPLTGEGIFVGQLEETKPDADSRAISGGVATTNAGTDLGTTPR